MQRRAANLQHAGQSAGRGCLGCRAEEKPSTDGKHTSLRLSITLSATAERSGRDPGVQEHGVI